MNYGYQDAAKKAATVSYVDEERRKAFEAGVEWATERLRRLLGPSGYEACEGYPKKLIDGYKLDDIRKIFFEGFIGKVK